MVFFSLSCAKLPVYQSKSEASGIAGNSNSKIADNTDAKKDIDFGISNDDSDLYLQVCFHKREDMTKIMRGGLVVYFDSQCKKKKNYSLTVTRENINSSPRMMSTQELINMAMNNQLPQNGNQRSVRFNNNIAETICKELEKVTWKKGDKELVFSRNENNSKIDIGLESANPSELILTIKMPLNEISVKTGRMLSLGIETGATGNQTRPATVPSAMSGGRGGSSGGGMGGSRGGMGGGGMRGSGTGGPMGAGQSAPQPFKFWFLAQL